MAWMQGSSKPLGCRACSAAAYLAALYTFACPLTARALGEGIKVSTGRLVTSLELETHHIQNPGYNTQGGSDLYLTARPVARLDFPNPDLELHVNADAEYRRFLGLGQYNASALSGFAGKLTTSLLVNQLGAFAFRAGESVQRIADTGNQTYSGRALHVANDVFVGFDAKPGGGALMVSADYALFYDRFDRSGNYVKSDAAKALDSFQQRPQLRLTWKFLPRTAVLLEGQANLAQYPGGGRYDNGAKNQPVNIVLSYLGAVGSITPKIDVLIKAGYGDTLISTDNYRTAVAQAELRYEITTNAKLRMGALRDIQPTSLFKYYGQTRGYVEYNHQFFGTTQARLNLAYSYLTYGADVMASGQHRVDQVFGGEVSLEHRFREWLSIAAIERPNLRNSTYVSAGGSKDSYFQNDVFLRLELVYP
jgi:hypothetical protein